MKRVVKHDNSELVDIGKCDENHIYIANQKQDSLIWGVLVAQTYGGKYRLIEINSGFTRGNGYGSDNGYANVTEALDVYMKDWEFYQFPDFRSAMEYYLEQSK